MKKTIGAILLTGVVATGCRPGGIPEITMPVVVAPTTASTPTDTSTAGQSLDKSVIEPLAEKPVAPEAPKVNVDLAELDGLLADLDNVLATLEDTMEEGEEQ